MLGPFLLVLAITSMHAYRNVRNNCDKCKQAHRCHNTAYIPVLSLKINAAKEALVCPLLPLDNWLPRVLKVNGI
jgi:hypothetical protein